MPESKYRVVQWPPLPQFAIVIKRPGRDEYEPYVRGDSYFIDQCLASLRPEDGELESDVRRAA